MGLKKVFFKIQLRRSEPELLDHIPTAHHFCEISFQTEKFHFQKFHSYKTIKEMLSQALMEETSDSWNKQKQDRI